MRTKIRRRGHRWFLYVVQADGKERGAGGFATQRAKAAGRALEVDSTRGSYVSPSKMTVADGYAEWAMTRKNLSPNSRAVEGVMWWSRILPVVGESLVQRFAQRDWHRLDDEMIARGLSGKYRRNVRASLRTFFEWCLSTGTSFATSSP